MPETPDSPGRPGRRRPALRTEDDVDGKGFGLPTLVGLLDSAVKEST